MTARKLTLTIALPLALTLTLTTLTACGQVADEAGDVVTADSLEEAREEASDVADEIGDAFEPSGRIEVENEWDRQVDELDEAIDGLGSSTDIDDRAVLEAEIEQLRQDISEIGNQTEDEWRKLRTDIEDRIASTKEKIAAIGNDDN